MKRILAVIALLAAPVLVVAQGDPIAGQSKTALCAACHGPTGLSIAPNFANLAGQGEKYLYKQILDIKSGARPVLEMTGMLETYTDQDLADIAAFYASQSPQVTGAQPLEDANWNLSTEDFLALGEKIYRFGNPVSGVPACTACHSPTGAGNAPAGFPAIGGQYSEYISNQLNNFRNNIRTNDGDAQMMRAAVQYMTDLEVRAVSNYAAGLYQQQ